MVSRSIYTEVEVEVDLSEFDDDELVQELEDRGVTVSGSYIIQQLHDAYILKQPDAVDRILRELFHEELGRIV